MGVRTLSHRINAATKPSANAGAAKVPHKKSSEDDMSDYFAGSAWSETYAKKALPVLVSLAESHRATTYTELAKILLETRSMGIP